MADKPSTTDTIKDFLSELADSTNKAYNDILDPPRKDNKHSDVLGVAGMLPTGHPMRALADLPAGTLQAMGSLANAGLNPLAALGGSASHAAGGFGGGNPLAALASGGGMTNPFAALSSGAAGAAGAGQVNPLGALGAVGGVAEGLAQLPQQIAQLTELLSNLTHMLQGLQGVAGAASGATDALGSAVGAATGRVAGARKAGS